VDPEKNINSTQRIDYNRKYSKGSLKENNEISKEGKKK